MTTNNNMIEAGPYTGWKRYQNGETVMTLDGWTYGDIYRWVPSSTGLFVQCDRRILKVDGMRGGQVHEIYRKSVPDRVEHMYQGAKHIMPFMAHPEGVAYHHYFERFPIGHGDYTCRSVNILPNEVNGQAKILIDHLDRPDCTKQAGSPGYEWQVTPLGLLRCYHYIPEHRVTRYQIWLNNDRILHDDYSIWWFGHPEGVMVIDHLHTYLNGEVIGPVPDAKERLKAQNYGYSYHPDGFVVEILREGRHWSVRRRTLLLNGTEELYDGDALDWHWYPGGAIVLTAPGHYQYFGR